MKILDLMNESNDQQERTLDEGKNHMGDREYQSYASWKAACKKAYVGCTFRGDIDIGAALLNGKDVGEWDGAVGSVYAQAPLKESTQFTPDEVENIVRAMKSTNGDIDPSIMHKLVEFYLDQMPYGTQKARDGDPQGWVSEKLGQIYSSRGENGIRNEFDSPMTEDMDHREMLTRLKQALIKASTQLVSQEDDLQSMKNSARSSKEHDAVEEYDTYVAKQRELVKRLKRRISLRAGQPVVEASSDYVASVAYKSNVAKVQQQLDMLELNIQRHQSRFMETDHTDWSHAGDMERLAQQLTDINDWMGK